MATPAATLPREKPYHHGDLRDALVKAGESALAELPLQEVSLREIARRAGVSHAAPKHHFPTVADLLGEIAASGFEKFTQSLREAADTAPDQTPVGRLSAMGRAYLRFAEGNAAAYGLMFGARGHTAMSPRLAAASFAAWEQLEQAVAAIAGPSRAPQGAMLVWATVHGLATLRAEQRIPPHLSPQAAVEQSLRMLLTGLIAEQPA